MEKGYVLNHLWDHTMYSAGVCLSLSIIQAKPPDNAYPNMLLVKKWDSCRCPYKCPFNCFGSLFYDVQINLLIGLTTNHHSNIVLTVGLSITNIEYLRKILVKGPQYHKLEIQLQTTKGFIEGLCQKMGKVRKRRG